MTFAACLSRLEAEGVIDADRVTRFRAEYDRLNTAYGKSMGTLDASMQASKDAMDALDFAAQRDAIQKVKQVGIQRQLLGDLTAHVENGGRIGHFLGAIMDSQDSARGVIGVAQEQKAVTNLAWSRMGNFTDLFKRLLTGVVSNKAELQDVARHLRGEKVENANAQLIGDAVADTFEWLRLQFNRAGGDIPRLKDWGMPQSHDAQMIAKAKAPEWKAFLRPLLDPAKMIDNQTGKTFADEGALDEALEAAWRNITSEGMDGAIPGAFTGKGKLANRRSDHRFLVFKDADAWLAYNERFGQGDLFDAITGHIDSMSRDIAAMRRLGPNPALTIRWLKDVGMMDALPTIKGGIDAKLSSDAKDGGERMERMWRYYAGELTMPHDRAVARFFSGAKNWNVATKLGRAFVTAFFTDPQFAMVNAKFNGLSQFQAMKQYVQSFNPLDASHREAARHAGIVHHELTARSEKMWREGAKMRFNLHEFARRSADFVLRATLLTPSTLAWKEAAALSWMKDWGDNANLSWADLGDAKRLSFERYGIDAADWERLRSTGVFDNDGISLLRPGDLARREDIDAGQATDSAVKFFAMMDGELKRRVVGEGLRAQTAAITLGGTATLKKGTVGGEIIHSATQFKTFGIAQLLNTWDRSLYGQGGLSGSSYAMRSVVGLWLGGIMAQQMIEISDGRDPLPWDEALLWKGFLRGGGVGIVGDILQGDGSRGDTMTGFLLGPLVSNVANPLYNLTIGNAQQAAAGDKTNVGREAVRLLKSNIPGGNAWYAKTAFNRMFLDELDAIADPDVRDAHRRMERRAEEQGTEYFWEPGEAAPTRAPQMPASPFSENDEGSLLQ